MRYETFEQWLDKLAGQNPMYDIFYGTRSLAFTTAAVLFAVMLITFARQKTRLGTGLLLGAIIAAIAGIEMIGFGSTSYISLGLTAIAWLAAFFMTVISASQHTAGRAAMTASKVLSYLALLSLATTFLSGMLLDVYYSETLVIADKWFWALNLVLIIATAASWLWTWQDYANRRNRNELANTVVPGTPYGAPTDDDHNSTKFDGGELVTDR